MNISKLFLLAILLFTQQLVVAQDSDQNESPYFQVVGDGAASFPLKSTDVDARIYGPIADVTLTQSYQNSGALPIEAIYVFPSSTRSAVYSMEMHIGERIVKADIMEKQKARVTYEKAKEEGKRTSLLEQHRPNVFQMNVANILPGEVVKVVMKYTEFLIPEEQQYTFHFPTVVGPRCTTEQSAEWAAQPYSKAGILPTATFDLRVHLQTSVPVVGVRSTSHKVVSRGQDGGLAVTLADDGMGGNRDFILTYELSGDQIEAGVQTYQVGGEEFFLCQVEPPSLEGKPEIAPREYIFIVDVSGSMSGYPLTVSKELMKKLFGNLRASDKFNILFFAGSAFAYSAQSVRATDDNVTAALAAVDGKSGGGRTNMFGAIKKAMATPKEDGYSRSFVIVTDGYVSVEEKAFDYVHQHLDDANFFAFGIGDGVNRHLIEGLAHVGRARPFVVTDASDAYKQAERLRKYIEYPLLTDISITGHGVELYDVVPDRIPDLMAGRPIYFFGKYRGAKNAVLEINGQNGCKPFYKQLALASPSSKNSALAQLWARETIRHLDDYNGLNSSQTRIDSITALGLRYNLLTKYTSFIAVDQEVVNKTGNPTPVKQVLPLPQGVPNLAVGFEMSIDPLTSESTSPRLLDITVASNDEHLQRVVEVLLQAILEKGSLSLDTDPRAIAIRTDSKGNPILTVADKDMAVVKALLAALRTYGFTKKELDFTIHIKAVK